MTLTDDILPGEPNGEVVHWMEPRRMQLGPTGISATAAAAFALGLAAAIGGFFLYRYLEPRRDALPPWRWSRGSIH